MKRKKQQSGHGLVEHVIQFALMAGIIVAIIYTCGGNNEETLPIKSKSVMSAQKNFNQRQQQSAYPQQSRPSRTASTRQNTTVQGGYQPVGDPRLIHRSDPRVRQRTLSGTENMEQDQETMSPSQARLRRQARRDLEDEEVIEVERNSPIAGTSRNGERTDLRVVRMRQEDPEKMGRIIIIVAVIALAVIVFWFIHSNMMYKRTLRAVASSHPKEEEEGSEEKKEEDGKKEEKQEEKPAEESAPAAHSDHGHGSHGHAEETPKEKSAIVERLGKLKAMLDQGLISQADYDAKKKDILANL